MSNSFGEQVQQIAATDQTFYNDIMAGGGLTPQSDPEQLRGYIEYLVTHHPEAVKAYLKENNLAAELAAITPDLSLDQVSLKLYTIGCGINSHTASAKRMIAILREEIREGMEKACHPEGVENSAEL